MKTREKQPSGNENKPAGQAVVLVAYKAVNAALIQETKLFNIGIHKLWDDTKFLGVEPVF